MTVLYQFRLKLHSG